MFAFFFLKSFYVNTLLFQILKCKKKNKNKNNNNKFEKNSFSINCFL